MFSCPTAAAPHARWWRQLRQLRRWSAKGRPAENGVTTVNIREDWRWAALPRPAHDLWG